MPLDLDRCSKLVYAHGVIPFQRQCLRKVWKDGRCKQHHPDAERARAEASHARYSEQLKNTPSEKLKEANASIERLTAGMRDLVKAMITLQTYFNATKDSIWYHGVIHAIREEEDKVRQVSPKTFLEEALERAKKSGGLK